jgi:hypothetical protein
MNKYKLKNTKIKNNQNMLKNESIFYFFESEKKKNLLI